MSRSYKRMPIIKDYSKSSKQNKQIANRKLRRKQNSDIEYEIGNGKEYKKHTQSYDIHDYISYWALEEALKVYRDTTPRGWRYDWHKEFKTEEEFINWWKREYLGK